MRTGQVRAVRLPKSAQLVVWVITGKRALPPQRQCGVVDRARPRIWQAGAPVPPAGGPGQWMPASQGRGGEAGDAWEAWYLEGPRFSWSSPCPVLPHRVERSETVHTVSQPCPGGGLQRLRGCAPGVRRAADRPWSAAISNQTKASRLGKQQCPWLQLRLCVCARVYVLLAPGKSPSTLCTQYLPL